MMQVGLLLLACAALRLGESYIFKGPMHMRKAQQAARSSRLHSEETYASQQEYLTAVKQRTVLPSGFSVGTARFTFSPKEVSDKTLPMNMTVILLDEPTPSYAAMFTSNQFPGAPVLVGRDLVSRGQALQAIVVNNKISNVCPGGLADGGRADCEAVCVGVEGTFGLEKGMVFPSSTGIIGWRLPVDTMLQNIVSEGGEGRERGGGGRGDEGEGKWG
ncbi:ArgJ-like domain-containing protein [Ochromonadaceae sp. CCMP2298]|nr:ArgJ-like domain-containing protein [Ochromonadaceae sp. CCMP2298]